VSENSDVTKVKPQMVDPRDEDFRVCLATQDDLVEINEEARLHDWTARWSSSDALRAKAPARSFAVLCPYERNGGDPASYKCYVWLHSSCPFVGLIDVSWSMLLRLHELSDPIEYKKAIQVLAGGYPIGCLD
jgi:hypothetical protein